MDSGLAEADLEQILDRLAEPQKQPSAAPETPKERNELKQLKRHLTVANVLSFAALFVALERRRLRGHRDAAEEIGEDQPTSPTAR